MKLIPAATCTEAWIKGATHLQVQDEAKDYNLILEISNPMSLLEDEKTVYGLVDKFLVKHKGFSINTVINTIFPASLYARYGAEKVLEYYTQVAPYIKEHPDNCWGTYALRMMSPKKDPKGKIFTPLESLVSKLSTQLRTKGPMRAAYELNLIDPSLEIPIYDCTSDRGRPRGGPCLSHLSFKLKHDRKLMLTAFYRSHYYVQRTLGNLLGLAWLQDFVAKKTGLQAAELVCISSMAALETEDKWGRAEINNLLKSCRKTLNYPEPIKPKRPILTPGG